MSALGFTAGAHSPKKIKINKKHEIASHYLLRRLRADQYEEASMCVFVSKSATDKMRTHGSKDRLAKRP